MRRGFTIVELMIVVGILAVLMSIVTVATSGAMKASRVRRRDAMAVILQEGLATYYARNGKWPDALEGVANSGEDKTYEGAQTDPIFQKIVRESVKSGSAPYLDVHALFVAPVGTNRKGYGVSFLEARRKDAPHRRQLGYEEMAFGYPDPSSGYFRRYKINYVAASDSVTVTY